MTMKLHPDFNAFIELLNKHKVKYLIVGGYAVAFHGYVQATGDLDIWLKIEKENAMRTLNVLKEFGFQSLGLSVEDFQQEYAIIQLGYPPYRIDLITTPDGVNFDECYDKRIESTDASGVKLNFIDLESLRKNKRSSGRRQDLLDLDNLPG